jgi:arylsulfatase A-like enzyme
MNVLLILLDDLGWNDIGYRNKGVSTPNIDFLFKDGCELNRNYTYSVCGPTRSMIQTGIYAYKTGTQRLIYPWHHAGLDPNLKLLPQYFKDLNYNTYCVGKWHLGHNDKKYFPHNRGYDYHFGHLTGCVDQITNKFCSPDIPEARLHDFSENGRRVDPKEHSCKALTDKVIEIFDKSKNNNFIYLAYLDPHVPFVCPQKFKNIYKNKKMSESRKEYLGMVSHVDFQIGKIIKKLKEEKVYEDTLIWLMSDNGGWTLNWTGGNNYPLNDGKCSFKEGGIRTVSVLKHKEIKSNKFEGFIHVTDVLPTLLDFCGFSIKEKIDGRSVYKELVGINKSFERDFIFSFFNENLWCFLFGNLKFTKTLKNFECYDIANDPCETKNLIEEKYISYKEKIENQIQNCLKERVPEIGVKKFTKEEIIKKCNNLNYWGQKDKSKIKLLSLDEESDMKKTESQTNFLQATGYDIFYEQDN